MSNDLYAEITASIVAEIESGCIPWLKPWKTGFAGDGGLPIRATANEPYRGMNVLLLWAAQARHGFKSGRWLTYKQAQAVGGHVRKGETSKARVIFYKKVEKKAAKAGDKADSFMVLKSYAVFNVEQCDGLPDHVANGKPLPAPHDLAENFRKFTAATKADIRHGGDSAYYSTSGDYVQMPHVGQFREAAGYKATCLHELAHWSGHKERLNRDLNNRFGGESYAAEELIAELTAAFLCADLGVKGELRHAAYVENWLKVLRNDKRAIFTAASKASEAAAYLSAFSAGKLATADDSDGDDLAAAA